MALHLADELLGIPTLPGADKFLKNGDIAPNSDSSWSSRSAESSRTKVKFLYKQKTAIHEGFITNKKISQRPNARRKHRRVRIKGERETVIWCKMKWFYFIGTLFTFIKSFDYKKIAHSLVKMTVHSFREKYAT